MSDQSPATGSAACTSDHRCQIPGHEQAPYKYAAPSSICPTRTPEAHDLGEFPMTCYRCHVEVDS